MRVRMELLSVRISQLVNKIRSDSTELFPAGAHLACHCFSTSSCTSDSLPVQLVDERLSARRAAARRRVAQSWRDPFSFSPATLSHTSSASAPIIVGAIFSEFAGKVSALFGMCDLTFEASLNLQLVSQAR